MVYHPNYRVDADVDIAIESKPSSRNSLDSDYSINYQNRKTGHGPNQNTFNSKKVLKQTDRSSDAVAFGNSSGQAQPGLLLNDNQLNQIDQLFKKRIQMTVRKCFETELEAQI